jgi:hypothetical protein
MVVRNNIKLVNKVLILKKFKNSAYRKMVLVIKKKFLENMEARQRVLYLYGGIYSFRLEGQNFYYPNKSDFSLELIRGTIEMAQPFYSNYIHIYMTKALKELNHFPRNSTEYNNYLAENIQAFGGLHNHSDVVSSNFAMVMFNDRFNIFSSLGLSPLQVSSSEMASLLTHYRVEADSNYLITRELLNLVSNAMLRDNDFALCALVIAGGSIYDFVAFEPGDAFLVIAKFSMFKSYLLGIGYLAANAAIPAADTVLLAAGNVPSVDPVPFLTVEAITDTGFNDKGSPKKPGFPFYSCIFGVLLVGVLIKTIFF